MRYFSKQRFTMWQVIGFLTIAFLGITAIAYAATVTIPNTFSPGNPILSGQVNDNFTALKSGIDQNKSVAVCSAETAVVELTTTTSDINTVSITVPGPGTILVSGSGTFHVDNSGTAFWEGYVWITDTTGGMGSAINAWMGPGGLPAGVYRTPVHEQRTFTVNAAGTYTYYFTGSHTGTQVVSVLWSNICAVFTPS
ncbi:MAG: hypothetical protein AABZ10_13930 [Nitrospirota bacterium]